ncbi:MAG: alpha-ribazole phosphatase [Chloroflexota bacterium]|nr:alpha-ribazole phosphatase [Chloroflexota bacterium]
MTTRLVLVRHCETSWNCEGRFQGWADVPLSEVGRRQAVALAAALAREEMHAIYSSDLRRAWDTALAVAQCHSMSVCEEPGLREMDFGSWEGLTYDQIRERWPNCLAAWQADSLHVAPPGGETLRQVADRVKAVVDKIGCAHGDQTVLLVGHGGSLQVLLCLALGLSPAAHWRLRLGPASITELSLSEAGAVLTRFNDVHHLSEVPRGR